MSGWLAWPKALPASIPNFVAAAAADAMKLFEADAIKLFTENHLRGNFCKDISGNSPQTKALLLLC